MDELHDYSEAVEIIKAAILRSQYDAVRSVNEKQLTLYYGIGKYISLNSRNGFWGKGAIDAISERLDKEMPGLRGFSARNLRYMRMFYEEWADLDSASDIALIRRTSNLALTSAKSAAETDDEIWHLQVPNSDGFPASAFFALVSPGTELFSKRLRTARNDTSISGVVPNKTILLKS